MKIGDKVRVTASKKELDDIDIFTPPPKETTIKAVYDGSTYALFGKCWRLDWNSYVIPECFLELIDDGQVVGTPNQAADPAHKGQTSMALWRVTAIATPSVIAQQAGKTESILLDNEGVIANDATGAALVAGAQNADKVKAVKDATIRTLVTGPL